MFRILKPGGRMLFSDALVVGGVLSHEEIATRSSIGFYVCSPPGENERLIEQAGFRLIRVHNGECGSNRKAVASGTGEKEEGTCRFGRQPQLRRVATFPVLRT
jgi:hypothetical protein